MDKVISVLRQPFGTQDAQTVKMEGQTNCKIDASSVEEDCEQPARAKWSKDQFPEITLETDKTEHRWTKVRGIIVETLDAIRALPSEVKEQVEVKLFKKEEVQVSTEQSETTESEIDGYEVIEMHEYAFLLGGAEEGQNNNPTTTVNVYDCVTKEWQRSTPLPMETTACTAVLVTSIPALVVIGGYGGWRALNTVQLFDFVTKEWRILPQSRKRRWGSYAASTNHGIVLAGGCDNGKVLHSVELYNFKKNEWYTLPGMKESRCNFAGTLIKRRLYVAGGGAGFYFNSAKDSAEMFDGETGEWTALPAMKYKRYGCAATAWKNRFIVLGGCDEQGVDVLPVEALDLEENAWSELPALPVGTSLCRVALIQNKMVAFGADGSKTTVHAFDFERNAWESFMEIPPGRNTFAVGVIAV